MKIGEDLALELARSALNAREAAYVPYSNFAVGAALLTKNGKIYLGCNIENAAFTPTNCAERTAVFKAVSEGERDFAAIAVAGGPAGSDALEACPPCGVCRQVLREFCPADLDILLVSADGSYRATTLGDLLPESFGPDFLE